MSDLSFVPVAEAFANDKTIKPLLAAFTTARDALEKAIQQSTGKVCMFGYRKNSAAYAETDKPYGKPAAAAALPAGITPDMIAAALAMLAKQSNGKAKRK